MQCYIVLISGINNVLERDQSPVQTVCFNSLIESEVQNSIIHVKCVVDQHRMAGIFCEFNNLDTRKDFLFYIVTLCVINEVACESDKCIIFTGEQGFVSFQVVKIINAELQHSVIFIRS